MTTWAVAPGATRSGGERVSVVGGEVGQMAGTVAASLTAIARSGGDADVGRAGSVAARRWQTALHRLGAGTAGLGTAVQAAVSAYEAADAAAAESFGDVR